MNIDLKVIPHERQAYPTCGNWYFRGETLVIRVSKMSDWRYELCVGVHEIVEALLCKHAGISEKKVSEFDIRYEKDRARGKYGDQEPGNDPDAPYRTQHFTADIIERILAAALFIKWGEYNHEVGSL